MLSFELIGGDTRTYGPAWGESGRRGFANDHDRLYMVTCGEIFVRNESGVEVRVVPGRLYLFTGGDTVRYYRGSDDAHLCWIHARVEAAPGMSLFRHFEPRGEVVPDFDAMATIREAVEVSRVKESPQKELVGVRCLTQLYQPFLPDSWEASFPFRNRMNQLAPALNYIHASLCQPLTLKEVAATVHLHPTYFSNLFKQVFGKSPLNYHQEQRMRWACNRLLTGEGSISDVAFECGYDDALYFSRQFKKQIGVSPREYRGCRGRLWP